MGDAMDRRSAASRQALLLAFKDLFQSTRYDDLSVTDIVDRADVSRSTFYEHFKSKDDLLRHSMSPLVRPLADLCTPDPDIKHVEWLIDHFRDVRPRALGLLNSPSAPRAIGVLASSIEERLSAQNPKLPSAAVGLAASLIAEAQFGLIRVWLTKGDAVPTAEVVATLVRGTRALAAAVVGQAINDAAD